MRTPASVRASATGPVDRPDAAGAQRVAERASRLLGTGCTAAEVLSARRLPRGGTALVVALRTASGTSLVAKAGPRDLVEAGVRAQSAAAAGLPGDGVLRVPQVVAAEPGLAVSEQVPGVPLHESIRSGELDGVRLAGRALAELAGLSGSGLGGHTRTLADHVAELVAPQPDALAPTGLPEPVVRMAQAIERAARAAEVTGPVGLVHRDVHPRQVLVDGSDVWLLDWDLACAGDPALDLANLVQHTRARLASPAADRVVEALLDGYAPSRDLQDRLPALEAFSALRLACKAARLRGAAAHEEAAILLLRAGVVLEGVGRRG